MMKKRMKWIVAGLVLVLGMLAFPQAAHASMLTVYWPTADVTNPRVTDTGQGISSDMMIDLEGTETVNEALAKEGEKDGANTLRVYSMLVNNLLTPELMAQQIVANNPQMSEEKAHTAAQDTLEIMKPNFQRGQKGYSITKDESEQTVAQKLTVYPDLGSDYYFIVRSSENNASQKITVTKGSQLESRQVTGVVGTTGLFVLDDNVYDPQTDVVLGTDNQMMSVETMPSYLGLTPTASAVNIPFTDADAATYRVVPKTDLQQVTVNYQYADGKQAAQSQTVNVVKGDADQTITSPTITGYTADQKAVTAAFKAGESTQTVTVTYQKPVTPPTTPTNPGTVVTPPTTTPSEPEKPVKPEKPVDPTTTFKSFKVYAKRALYTYSQPTFTKQSRVKGYPARSRTTAPTFTVVGVARSTQGRLRYQLANGRYITASSAYVGNLYWQGQYRQFRVINRQGSYTYRTTKLTKSQRVKFLKRGTVIKVKRVSHYGMMTRYQLSNGTYITGNKQWVTVIK